MSEQPVAVAAPAIAHPAPAELTDNQVEAVPAEEHTTTRPDPDDHGVHPDELPTADNTPDHIAQLSTTNSDAPAVASSHPTAEKNPVDPELEDLGWSEDPRVPVPLIRGLNNEQLWILVRRFNKQM